MRNIPLSLRGACLPKRENDFRLPKGICANQQKRSGIDLIEVVNRIKNETVLVLNNEDQAKVFTTINDGYFGQPNRGLLERVEIGNVGDDTKRIIWNKLVKAGMELEYPILTFKFP
ncbi:hypothetical protein ACJRO7_001917 [Eucalyptus globulus]|uniref:Uncharacterized protein n=1 Tax=Eucalyptus globulus TaxID=34317 RepID=A0ABD3LSI1_EUCGL